MLASEQKKQIVFTWRGQAPLALFIDEAHDLNGHTLIGLKRLMKVVEDVGGRPRA